MSNTQFAFIKKGSVPTREQLQKSIELLAFNLDLDPDFTPFEDEGFSPCVLNGEKDIGFEIYYEPSKDIVEEDEDLISIAGDKDYCISMCWGGSLKDYACVMIVSCALVKDFQAVISYEGEDPEPLTKMISDTKDIIKEADIDEQKTIEAQKALEEARRSGNPKELVQELLTSIVGTSVLRMVTFGGLAIQFSNSVQLSAKAFACVNSSGDRIDVTRYPELRAKQILLMQDWDGEPSKEQQALWDELELQLDMAGEADENMEKKFLKEVESWPEDLRVEKIEWPDKGELRIIFSNVPNAYIEMYAFDSVLSTISLRTDLLEFKITPDEFEIL